MIAPIDDDLDSARDFEDPEPGSSWFDCPMLPRGDMLAIIIKRYKDLDGRAVNLFYSGQLKRIGTDGVVCLKIWEIYIEKG